MKAFGLAFMLWGGTILLCCTLIGVAGILIMKGFVVAIAVIGFFFAVFISCPLLLPTTLLIQLACKIPYTPAVRILWLGFMLILQNYLYFELLSFADTWFFDRDVSRFFFAAASVGLVFMLRFKRTVLKIYFSQQTTNKIS